MKRNLIEGALGLKEIEAVENDGTSISGVVIDRQGYQSAILCVNWAASSGTPTTAVASLVIHDAAEQAFNVTNALYATLETAKNVKTAGFAYYYIDLAKAKRYIRAILDITYVDGTSPKNILSADLILGDKWSEPVGTTTVSP